MSLTVKTLMEVKRFDKDCMLNYHKWCPFCLTDDHYKALPLCLHITSNRVDRRGFSLIFGKKIHLLCRQSKICFPHGRDDLEVITKLKSTTANIKLKHQMLCEINRNIG